MCCQVDGSATGRQIFLSFPTDYDVSECDRETSIKKKLWPTMAVES